jgi:hypothetical protein
MMTKQSHQVITVSALLLAMGALLFWSRHRDQRKEFAKSERPSLSSDVKLSPLPQGAAPPHPHQAHREAFPIKPKGKLTKEDVEKWINARGRDVTALLGGYSVTKDPALLSEALTKDPDNPTVLIANAIGGTAENKAYSIDQLKKQTPDDAYPNILAALNKFSIKDVTGAIQELADAHSKSKCNEHDAEFTAIQMALQQEMRGDDALRAYGNRNSYRAYSAGDLYTTLGQELKRAIDSKMSSSNNGDLEQLVAIGINLSHRYTDSTDLRRHESGLAMEADFLKYLYGSQNIQILDKPLQEYMAEREIEAAGIRQLSAILGRLAKENHPDYQSITQRAMAVGSLRALEEYAATHPEASPN